ncbi:unnamed protein product [Clavelina lepadiformis]|uniref:Uncharacterized protein n=1 Tax=Clavelina lepadiformis TaxID=159417 RepID=A0ABP0EXE9_CLALP
MRNTSPLRGKPISEDIYLTETLGLHPQENYYEIKQLFPAFSWFCVKYYKNGDEYKTSRSGWPSGQRRQTQAEA